jgi:hypothetical protein
MEETGMKEYIERAAILKSLGYDEKRRADVLPGSTFDIVLKEAAADVAEVRHGKIIETIKDGKMNRVFSCCGHDFTELTCWYMPKYCPN